MRLSGHQIDAIRTTTHAVFGVNAQVRLFGSRVDDSLRGGDIDLLITPVNLPNTLMFDRKLDFLGQLRSKLGDRKIDVVIEHPQDARPIVQVAHQTGVVL
jgi:uncharacterized protein